MVFAADRQSGNRFSLVPDPSGFYSGSSHRPQLWVCLWFFEDLFFLIIWIYYSFVALLAGAELVANLKRREALIFKGLFYNRKAGRRIPSRFIRAHEKGDVVFREGEVGGERYFVLSGAVAVSKEDKMIRVIKENEFFGELAMLLNLPRSATVTVMEPDTRLIGIAQDNFETLLRENPDIVLTILRVMSRRLETVDEEAGLPFP
jgi:hypothetical protein